MNARRGWGAVAAVAFVVGLAACDPETADESDAGQEQTEAGTGEPEEARTLPPEFLECGNPDDINEEDGLMLADLDLSQAHWAIPEGFRPASGYIEDNPVETLQDFAVYEPDVDAPLLLNVVSVVRYQGLDWGDAADACGRVPVAAVEERLAGYREAIGAEPMTDAEMTLLAGHPAITQEIALREYEYVGYWLFSPTQLLHLYCQWTPGDGQQDVIRGGCDDLASSLVVD